MPRQRKKLFVLDTNVLLHDPNSFLRFANNDIAVPFVTLEELDKHKTGQQDINRNARAAIRLLEQATQQPGSFEKGFSLKAMNHGGATGTLRFLNDPDPSQLPPIALDKKADNRFLQVMLVLRQENPKRPMVLVSKDLNLRVKARAMGFASDDYLHDHAVEDADLLYQGYRTLTSGQLQELLLPSGCWTQKGVAFYSLQQPAAPEPPVRINEFVTLDDGSLFRVLEATENEFSMRQETNYTAKKNAVWGVTARNDEQSFALSLLMDPEIDFVTLLGPAGTGKTLLTLAAALHQTREGKQYQEIIFTRATVPLGEDIGFLPGTEEEKMAAWMGALDDNLEVLAGCGAPSVKPEELRETVKVKAISFMRGRTFHRKFLIIDEAQNLTPKQMKALVTRSGPGTKVVCMGNLAQIDTPYLSETSSGLTFAVEGFKGWEHYGHLILQKGERSRLANYANENL
ncbi:PhoH-like protein [compost metagenome]